MRHHYLPIFFTKAWAGADRKLCKFSWEHGSVRASRRGPRDTGFEDNLYLNVEAPAGREQDIERRFMATTDQRASDALKRMLAGNDVSPKNREGWTRFIMSLWRRSPARMAELAAMMASHAQASVEVLRDEYPTLKRASDPDSFDDFKATLTPQGLKTFSAAILPSIIELKGVGRHIVNMRWRVVTLYNPKWTFLTSDQPVHRPLPLQHSDAFIALAVGPKKFFLATNTAARSDQLRDQSLQPEFARIFNEVTCQQAARLVIGDHGSHRRFVQNHLKPPPVN